MKSPNIKVHLGGLVPLPKDTLLVKVYEPLPEKRKLGVESNVNILESSKKLEVRPVSVGFSKMGIWLPFPSARKHGVACFPLAVWYLCAWTPALPGEDQGMAGNAKKQGSRCGGLQPRSAPLSVLLLRAPPGTFQNLWNQGERGVSASPRDV